MAKASALHAQLVKALGPGYLRNEFKAVRRRGVDGCFGWLLEDLEFETKDGALILAYFLRPPVDHAPVPAVVYCHAHGNNYAVGRDELTLGRPALQSPYAKDLVALGCAALCIDMPCFGARQEPAESALSKALAWQGDTLFGTMLGEQAAAISFLAAQPMVQAGRIGAMGFSMGSTLAWWLAALDERILAASAMCSFADLGSLVGLGAHDGHGHYMTVPGLLNIARSGEIAALIAPRALQICVGLQDWSTPEPAFARARQDLEAGYSQGGDLRFHIEPEQGHVEPPAMRAAVLDFLRDTLIAP
ncbi:MAG: dienelactone hydrolase family protein [Paracoccaceae bacterium]